jgi:hypothetical protein
MPPVGATLGLEVKSARVMVPREAPHPLVLVVNSELFTRFAAFAFTAPAKNKKLATKRNATVLNK